MGLPVIDGVAAGPVAGPEVALLGFPIAGTELGDGCFIYLKIAATHDSGADHFIDGLEPVGHHAHPVRHGLPGQMHAVARPADLPAELGES